MPGDVGLSQRRDSETLLNAVTTTGAGNSTSLDIYNTFQAIANGSSGAFSVTVKIQVSNDNVNWIDMGTISLSGTATTADADGFTSNAAWKYVRANVTDISGTGANVTITMGG